MRKPSINEDRARPPPSYKERSRIHNPQSNYLEPVRKRESSTTSSRLKQLWPFDTYVPLHWFSPADAQFFLLSLAKSHAMELLLLFYHNPRIHHLVCGRRISLHSLDFLDPLKFLSSPKHKQSSTIYILSRRRIICASASRTAVDVICIPWKRYTQAHLSLTCSGISFLLISKRITQRPTVFLSNDYKRTWMTPKSAKFT